MRTQEQEWKTHQRIMEEEELSKRKSTEGRNHTLSIDLGWNLNPNSFSFLTFSLLWNSFLTMQSNICHRRFEREVYSKGLLVMKMISFPLNTKYTNIGRFIVKTFSKQTCFSFFIFVLLKWSFFKPKRHGFDSKNANIGWKKKEHRGNKNTG